MSNSRIGPIFIMFAASLWAIDAIFRTQLTFSIPPASIVMIEHAIGFLFLSPFLFKNISSIRALKLKEWLMLLAMTVVSSVLGTLLFTEALARSFAQFDFVTPILLQKLQPVFVIILSALFLKERLTPRFIMLAFFALFGSYLISFGFQPVQLQFVGKELVFMLAIGAAASWGAGTILSKYALKKLSFPALSALRFLLAVPVAYLFSLFLNQTYNLMSLQPDHIWRFIVIAGVTGGAFAIFIYYKGLKMTQAKISTMAELSFPIVSILIAVTPLNPYGEPQQITVANTLGIIILLWSIVMISFGEPNKGEK